MKKFVVFVCAVTLVFGLVGMARATLIQQTQGSDTVIYDDVNEKYWIWDLSKFTNQTYQEQKTEIGDLDYFGTTDWVMADRTLMDELWDEFDSEGVTVNEVFGMSASDFWDKDHWIARYDEAYEQAPARHFVAGCWVDTTQDEWHYYAPGAAFVEDAYGYDHAGAWAVADTVEPIPEPGTVFLLGAGIFGLMALRRKVSHER